MSNEFKFLVVDIFWYRATLENFYLETLLVILIINELENLIFLHVSEFETFLLDKSNVF